MARKTKAQIQKEKEEQARKEELRRWITIVILSAFVIIGLMKSGLVGRFIYSLQRFLFGDRFWLVPIIIVLYTAMLMVSAKKGNDVSKNPLPVILIIAGILLLCTYTAVPDVRGLDVLMDYVDDLTSYFNGSEIGNTGGGLCGAVLYALTSFLFARSGSLLVIVVLFLIAALLIVSLDTYKKFFRIVFDFFKAPEDEEEEEEEEEIIEEPKENPNLWNMIHKAKEERRQKLGDLKADEGSPKEETTILTTGKDKNVVREETKITTYTHKMPDILADGPTEEIALKDLPEEEPETLMSPSTSKVFINVEDLYDSLEPKESGPVPEVDYEEEYDMPEEEEIPVPEIYDERDADDPYALKMEEVKEEKKAEKKEETKPAKAEKPRKPKVYKLPPASLLDPLPAYNANNVNAVSAREKGELLINILKNFDIDAQLIDTHIGPSVTQFEIRPDVNVKVSKILSLSDNIKMQLAAKDVRIEAPIPGRNAVGIEIPNVESTPVKMRELVSKIPAKEQKQPLLFMVGKDLLGEAVTCRLDKMPHMLIAGATGSGKSVCMNSIITSLLLRTKPDEVKMLLVDPKKVEFTPYQKIPHLIGPVINDANKANNALKVIVRIMDERYDMFSKAGVRNITVYNEKVKEQGGRPNPDGSPAPKPMPYIVVIIDELADLMMVAGKEVEGSIQRITQLARAAGIHLIVATQRPSTDVITGIIKANIPSRIAFSVSSGIDSRTILDHVGAERLLGNGDMLYMPIGQNSPTRVQGVFVTDDEVKRITDYCSAQQTPMYDDAFVLLDGIEGGEDNAIVGASEDPLYNEIREYVIDVQKASTSLLQRRFGIGYNRAARMIDCLEEHGIIGPAQGSKPREVYAKKEED